MHVEDCLLMVKGRHWLHNINHLVKTVTKFLVVVDFSRLDLVIANLTVGQLLVSACEPSLVCGDRY